MSAVAVLFTAWGVCFLAFVWFIACNARTYRQRGRLIDAYKSDEEWRAFRAVSYDQHLWALVTFRNPDRLYATCLLAARDQTP